MGTQQFSKGTDTAEGIRGPLTPAIWVSDHLNDAYEPADIERIRVEREDRDSVGNMKEQNRVGNEKSSTWGYGACSDENHSKNVTRDRGRITIALQPSEFTRKREGKYKAR